MKASGLVRAAAIACVLLVGVATACSGAVQFRAFWADAFHVGYKSKAQIDSMISRAVTGRCNAIIAEVLANHDTGGSGHGAYWRSQIVPMASDIDLTGLPNGDPLAYLVEQAHANGIEVHCWLVAFRVCGSWPPAGNPTLQAHPEWLMSTKANLGLGPSKIGTSDYVLDPGSSDVQEYLMSIVRELVTNYAIDGIHWDYIRYTQSDAGYPTDDSYANSGLKRFQRIYGRSGVPDATADAQWDDFRRREVTEVVRRCLFEVRAITGNPRQPLRHTAALIPWGNAPSNFQNSSAWARFQNWEEWMRLGFLDAGCLMLYYRECQYPDYYRNWVDACIRWRYQRHMFIGQGIYLNMMPWSITQMQYAYDNGADGSVAYSYASTRKAVESPCTDTAYSADWTWYQYLADNLFTSAATLPTMPWRNATTATEGTLYGRVTDGATGLPIDDATVTVAGTDPVQTDGNGYYITTMLSASNPGTNYSASATKADYPAPGQNQLQTRLATITPGGLTRVDFPFGCPVISNIQVKNITATSATITWSTDRQSDSQVEYGLSTSYGQTSPLNSNLVTVHSVALSGLQPQITYYFRVKSKTGAGLLSAEGPRTFTTYALATVSLGTGWNMISLPIQPADPDPAVVFAGINIESSLYRYDHTLASYVDYFPPQAAEFGSVKMSDGYWLYLAAPATISYSGTVPSGPVSIPLPTRGWYMVGKPHGQSQLLSSCQVKSIQTSETKPISEARGSGWLELPLYRWNPAALDYHCVGVDGPPLDDDDTVRAWEGFWLCSQTDSLELVVPKP